MELTAGLAPELTALAVWLNTVCAPLDHSVATAVHSLYTAAGGFFTPFFSFVSVLGKGGIFLILLSIALILYQPTRRYGTTMLLAMAIGALITNLCVKPLIYRPRPYLDTQDIYYQFWLVVGQHTESDYSFPSGHMTAATAASMAVFLVGNKKKSWTALIFAFCMGVSRIYLSVHYTTDVLGGVLVGCFGAVTAYFIVRALPKKYFVSVWFPARRGAHSRPKQE